MASHKEIASLEKHDVYELVPITSIPNRRKVVGTRWVNKIKADGVYKGRLVVLGWSRVPGIDCGGTYAPVWRLQSIRMVLAIVVELDYEVYMLDVQTAFHNADVEEDFFVKMAPGYERSNESGVPLAMKLKESPCDLRQSPKNWFSTTMDHPPWQDRVSLSQIGPVRLRLRGQEQLSYPDSLRERCITTGRQQAVAGQAQEAAYGPVRDDGHG